MKILITYILLGLVLLACSKKDPEVDIDELKQVIYQTERTFEQMAAEKGVAEAFSYYIADSGVINRDTIYVGKQGVRRYFDSWPLRDVSLEWEPDYIDVSTSGDMAYTYGQYKLSATDTSGNPIEHAGIFHTVWKKQQDGSWRFVWD